MTDESKNLCPCSSGDPYQECCKRLHEGGLAENALQLMRSRFAAYAFNIPEYIVITTHPANPQYSEDKFTWKRRISQFSNSSSFDSLEIRDFKQNEAFATVTFTAHITQEENDGTFTEKSFFEFFHGRWLYRGGQLTQGHAPNLVTTGQLRLLPLAYYGDSILRKKADSVKEISDDIKKLAEEMIETMDACNGVGLAAPQVHHSIRLFVTRIPTKNKDDKYVPGEAKVFINLEIVSRGTETCKSPEGCLSVPTIRAEIERYNEITVKYMNLEGMTITEKLSGLAAKAVQHENEHTEGVLFIDHLSTEERSKLEPSLNRLKKRIHDGCEM